MGFLLLTLFSVSTFASLGNSYCSGWEEALPSGYFRSLGPKLIAHGYESGDPRGKPVREATVFGEENRVLADASIYPYRTIGKFYHDKGACSSALISPCHVLTSRHCMNPDNNNYRVQFGQRNFVTGTSVLQGKGKNFEADWAVVKLHHSVGKDLGWMSILPRTPKQLEDGKCRLGGYPADIDSGLNLYVDETATFKGDFSDWQYGDPPAGWKAFGKHMAQLKADAYLGNSGGPIFCMDSMGVAHLVAVMSFIMGNSKGNVYVDEDSDRYSGAVATSSFAKAVKKLLAKDSCPDVE